MGKTPERIRKLLLANALCRNCGAAEFAPGCAPHMRKWLPLIEGHRAKYDKEVAATRPRGSTGLV